MKNNKLTRIEVYRTFIAIAVSLILVLILIFFVSEEPVAAITDFVIGPLTSVRRMGNVVEAMVPLIFTGLAMTVIYRAGMFNLAVEGAFFAGAVTATACALSFSFPPIITLVLSMACATLTGAFVTFIPAVLKVKCDANELVTSLMLNYVCLFVGLYVITAYFFDPTMNSTYSYMFNDNIILPRIIEGTRITAGIFIAIFSVFAVWIILNKTSFGYKVTLVGNNPLMAKYSGVNVGSVIIGSQILGGALAGLGGSVDLFGMYRRFQYTGLTGYGWDGILVAVVARKKPEYVPLAALFLAYIRTGADIMSRNNDIPFEIINIIQSFIIVLVSMGVILEKYKQRAIKESVEVKESLGKGGAV